MSFLYSEDRKRPGVYHVWARARGGLWMFRDDADRRHFEALINRHLSCVAPVDSRGRPLLWLHGRLRLYARNLLSTHFHLVLWQVEPGVIEQLMRSVMTGYSRYYRRRYGHKGELFEGRYRARRIEDQQSLRWRIAYVHFNHQRLGLDWEFSTHHRLLDPDPPGWIAAAAALKVFGGRESYLAYLEQYRTLRLAEPEPGAKRDA